MATVQIPKVHDPNKHVFKVGDTVMVRGQRIFTARQNDSAFKWNEGIIQSFCLSKPIHGKIYPMAKIDGKWFTVNRLRYIANGNVQWNREGEPPVNGVNC